MRFINILLAISLSMATVFGASAQKYGSPLKTKIELSANFGELRENHFHSGLDIKTEGVVGKAVYSVGKGYISRIGVSPSGYGLVLYIDHPEGYTSVYGHLSRFSKEIADYVKEMQYTLQSYSVNLYPQPDQFPIKAGDQIALTGNTGGSGGPHLHFEIRNTKTETILDPLKFLTTPIADTQRPDIKGIAVYPMSGEGVVNRGNNPIRVNITKNKAGTIQPLSQTITAWGKIGFGVKAFDKMNGQHNIYGVKSIRVFVDEKLIFSSSINEFSFDKTRMINSFIDFHLWRTKKDLFVKTFIEPGNTLTFFQNIENNGICNINEERLYRIKYELQDYYGNTTLYDFNIKGQSQLISPTPNCTKLMSWNTDNHFTDKGFIIKIPNNNLYNNICFTFHRTNSSKYFSAVCQVNNRHVPLHKEGFIWIELNSDSIPRYRSQYGIVITNKEHQDEWVGGKYKNGGIEARIRELGYSYAVSIDTIAPKIEPINQGKWVQQRKINIRLSDNESRIGSFRGDIDGHFALFKHDMKSPIYSYIFDDSRLEKGKNHILTFTATDKAGNSNIYKYEFVY